MKYIVDNDMHIHSYLSLCAADKEQTAERILQYAKENGLTTICVTDHLWDEKVKINGVEAHRDFYVGYLKQDFPHVSEILPLPKEKALESGIRFLFGCETELDFALTVGLSKERMDEFDFIIIPTTHLHMLKYTLTPEQFENAENRAKAWVERLDAVLNMDLPFHKIGLAHLSCSLIGRNKQEFFDVMRLLPEDEMKRLFEKAAELGVGIEIHGSTLHYCETKEETELALRPFRIAKQCGCKFYLGSDAHRPHEFKGAKERFEQLIDLLELTEDDKFII